MKRAANETNFGLGCPHCHQGNRSRVVDSRDNPVDRSRRRRHECYHCERRFTTYEIPSDEYERFRTMRINPRDLEKVITVLRAIKVQFSE